MSAKLHPAGSPPRMRGKDEVFEVVPQDAGITPAYAGKSVLWGMRTVLGTDHPRVCVEKVFKEHSVLLSSGSPPRMRGKESIKDFIENCNRITPAYAGKRLYEPLGCITKRDHPRVCGEKWSPCGSTARPPGITPAYAGKSGTVGRSTEHRYPWKLCGIPAAHGCPRVPAAAA